MTPEDRSAETVSFLNISVQKAWHVVTGIAKTFHSSIVLRITNRRKAAQKTSSIFNVRVIGVAYSLT